MSDQPTCIWQSILDQGIHEEDPFKPGMFVHYAVTKVYEATRIGESLNEREEEEARIQRWLRYCPIPRDQTVYLSWQPRVAVRTTWDTLVRYWSAFYYPVADDLCVVDDRLEWCLLFHHEHQIHFGTNQPPPTIE